MTTANLETRLRGLLGTAEPVQRTSPLPRNALCAAIIVAVFFGGIILGQYYAATFDRPLDGASLRTIQAHLSLVAYAEGQPLARIERELLDCLGRASLASVTEGEYPRAYEWLDTRARRALQGSVRPPEFWRWPAPVQSGTAG